MDPLLSQLHLQFDCEMITYLLRGGPGCSRGIHGNSMADSISFYSNYVDSLQQMPDMPSLQLKPKSKSTILMTKPWSKKERNTSEKQKLENLLSKMKPKCWQYNSYEQFQWING